LKGSEALKHQSDRTKAALRKSIAADTARQAKYGDAWDAIAKAHRDYASYAKERPHLRSGRRLQHRPLFGIARTLVRLAEESPKLNSERLPEFTDARRPSLELGMYAPAPIYDDFEKLKLTDSLEFMVELLGANDPAGEASAEWQDSSSALPRN
jgi:hypothetical protein